MCLLCAEIIKEQMTPKDFWRNYREIREDHVSEVIGAVATTSFEYQAKIANAAGEDFLGEDDGDEE